MGRNELLGPHRAPFDRNKKKILATQKVCALCGREVDKTLRYPHPLSPSIDHVVPISRGGHPSSMVNLQLAHFTCNRQKADKLTTNNVTPSQTGLISNRILPQSRDWTNYKPDED